MDCRCSSDSVAARASAIFETQAALLYAYIVSKLSLVLDLLGTYIYIFNRFVLFHNDRLRVY